MSTTPTIDYSVIDELKELQTNDPTLVSELIREFMRSAPERVDKIAEGVKTGAAEVVYREAHTLKSSAGSLGAMRLSEAARDLETLGRSGRLDGAQALFARLQAEYDTAKPELMRIGQTA